MSPSARSVTPARVDASAVVVGSGPNGLAAAITLARAGVTARVLEAAATPGGGMRSFRNERFGTLHDQCSAVHPLALISPFFRSIGLARNVEFVRPPRPWAHGHSPARPEPGPPGTDEPTPPPSHAHGPAPAPPLTHESPPHRRRPDPLTRFAASLAGVGAHAMLPPHTPLALGTAALLGGTGLLAGWPIPRGGSQAIVDFLVRTLESLGGTIECNRRVDPGALPPEILSADLVLWDTDATTAHLAARPDTPAPPRRYGPGAAKADFVTNAPIPWSDPAMRQAGTVHLGGTWSDVSAAERAINSGRPAEHPVVLVSQPSLFDSSRAPAGLHTVWAYAHVPFGSRENPAEIITREIERFAPGFSATVLDVRTTTAEQLSEYNLNYVGGDIATGATRGLQMLTGGSLRKARAGESTGAASLGPAGGPGLDRGLRKSWRSVLSSSTRLRLPVHSLLSWPARFAASPWTLPRPGWYLCSAATPPGPGVHGMAGYIAARLALQTMDQPAPSSLRRAYQAMTPCP